MIQFRILVNQLLEEWGHYAAADQWDNKSMASVTLIMPKNAP
jgi:hypothetical protein